MAYVSSCSTPLECGLSSGVGIQFCDRRVGIRAHCLAGSQTRRTLRRARAAAVESPSSQPRRPRPQYSELTRSGSFQGGCSRVLISPMAASIGSVDALVLPGPPSSAEALLLAHRPRPGVRRCVRRVRVCATVCVGGRLRREGGGRLRDCDLA
eukprot:335443-Chlamydomonas_euryale.AAC.3